MAKGPNWRGMAKAKVPVASAVREATQEDLERLRSQGPIQQTKSRLKTLKDSHHRCAILFAAGLTNRQIAEVTGRSLNNISLLRNDPGMKELTESYRAEAHAGILAEVQDMERDMVRVQRLSVQGLLEKYQEAAESGQWPADRDLNTTFANMADRIGPIKSKGIISTKGDFADRLAEAIAKSNAAKLVGQSGPTLNAERNALNAERNALNAVRGPVGQPPPQIIEGKAQPPLPTRLGPSPLAVEADEPERIDRRLEQAAPNWFNRRI
jgi:hypothetical protein